MQRSTHDEAPVYLSIPDQTKQVLNTVNTGTYSPNPIPKQEELIKMSDAQLELLFHTYVSSPQATCSSVVRMGNITDGGWEVCLDPRYAPDPSNCLVYSFGYGKIKLNNPHITLEGEDNLYHIALGNKTHDLEQMFSDTKIVCFGGSADRMKSFAHFLVEELNIPVPTGMVLQDISHECDRYVVYKAGPVLCVSHGMGIPSMSIIFQEILKLMYHAGCSDVIFVRIGTCGGIGLEPGSVVITEEAVNGLFQPYMEMAVLGKTIQMPGKLDLELAQELKTLASENKDFQTVIGKTMCTLGFYEGQGRLAFCDHNREDKAAFLERVYDHGICNMEMESLCFAAYCHRAGIRGAVVCVTLVNRVVGDQINAPKDVLSAWSMRPQILIAKFIKKKLGL